MKASAFLFRYRMIVLGSIVALGFWAPWIEALSLGSRISLLEWLALEISRAGLLTFTVSTPVVIIAGALAALAGAVLRIWASAWLGHGIVINANMQAAALTADGPYRYVRNPLYLGMFLWMAAMCLLMPPTGALFTLIGALLVMLGLIRGEESFLAKKLGDPYRAYLRAVPRIFPRLRTTLAPSCNKPHWLQAVLSEITPIGVFFTFACLSWTYNNRLMMRAVLVSFGVSLVARALMPGLKPAVNPSEAASAPE
jgi:protein-S-isoprenylcysteine O-methyltransferase Ste14